MSSYNIPILIVAFNRYDTTIRVFEQIRQLKPKYLYIALDAPRSNKEGELEKCNKVKSIFDNIDWDCEVHKLFREENLGCKMGPFSAITWFFEHVEHGIIFEDDILVDPSFFPYAEEMLAYYKNDDQVMAISSASFQPKRRSEYSYYFSNYSLGWGWATWAKAWAKYDLWISGYDKNILLENIPDKSVVEKLDDKYRRVIANEFTTCWDYQWNYNIWKHKGICITPETNLCLNIGIGDDATHTLGHDFHTRKMKMGKMDNPIKHPPTKKRNIKADKYYESFVLEPSFFKSVFSKYFPWFYKIYVQYF